MSGIRSLVADLDRCMGCFACEVACKQEHKLPEGQKGIDVLTLGPFEVEGELAMDFVPFCTARCNLCAGRTKQGKKPFCVDVCPTQALGLYEAEEILSLLRSKRRIHICNVKKDLP
jgi:Fe-S-cluster-containing dehydrogenase component